MQATAPPTPPTTPAKPPGAESVRALHRTDPERAEALSRSLLCAAEAHGDPRGLADAHLALAFCYLDAADYGAALAQAAAAAAYYAENADAAGTAEVGVLRSAVACRRGAYDDALADALAALEQARALGARALEAQALVAAGEVCGYRGDYGRAGELLERALGLAEALGDPFLVSETLLVLSRLHRSAGDYEGALRRGLDALAHKRRAGDPLGEAYALNNLGLIHHDPYDSAEALVYYLEGLALSERLGNRRCTLVLLGNLGELYTDLGDPHKALPYVRQSLALSEEIGSPHTAGISLEGLGDLCARLGDYEGARTYYERALRLRREIGDKQGEATTLLGLGRLCGATSELERAAAYLSESLALAREVSHPYTEARVLVALGALHLPNDPERARAFYEDALALAEPLKLPTLVRDCAAALADLFEDQRDFERALGHLKTFSQTDRKLTDERAARRTERLLVRFELERAEAEAEAQRLHNAELARANQALHETNRQNAKLLARLREQTAHLKRQATEDSLTGLYNRRYAERQLKLAFRRAGRTARPLSVALADIDDFKRINDHFSHAVGDRVLRAVGAILSASLRPDDVAARYGGEEFALIFPETDAAGGRAVCERLRRAVEVHPWHELAPDLRVTLSIGLCSDPALPSYERLLAVADEHLYRAKANGKNQVV